MGRREAEGFRILLQLIEPNRAPLGSMSVRIFLSRATRVRHGMLVLPELFHDITPPSILECGHPSCLSVIGVDRALLYRLNVWLSCS